VALGSAEKAASSFLKVLKEQNDAKGSNAIRPAGNGEENGHNLHNSKLNSESEILISLTQSR